MRADPYFLQLWLAHHSKHFSPLFVLCHQKATPAETALCRQYNATQLIVHNPQTYCWNWITEVANRFATFLLNSYPVIAYTDVDEFIVGDLQNLPEYPFRCHGISLIQRPRLEDPYQATKPLSAQRGYYTHDIMNSKPAFRHRSQADWLTGAHFTAATLDLPINSELFLIHLHFFDLDCLIKRHLERGPLTHADHRASHNYIVEREALMAYLDGISGLIPISAPLKPIIDQLHPLPL